MPSPSKVTDEAVEAAIEAFVASLFRPDENGDCYYSAEDDPVEAGVAWGANVREAVEAALPHLQSG